MRVPRRSSPGGLGGEKGTFLDDNDRDDHAVDAENTGHYHRYNRFHDEFGLEHSHGADSHSRFGAPVCGSEIGEDEGGSHSDVPEEVVAVAV
ncbi:unnamed protein product [Sphagnum balticum]